MALETKDLELLAKPLPVEAHRYLNGLVYLTEEPITERLDEVDPAWQWEIVSIVTRDNAGDGGNDVGTVQVHGRLTLKGVARDNIGMAVIQKTKGGGSEANEAEKAAATDALKRAARMFGIGRYILAMGKAVTNEQQLRAWLKQHYSSQQNQPAPASTPNKLDPEAHGLHKLDRKLLNELTMPLYGDPTHQENSINKLLSDGVLKPDMNADTAAAYVFKHRAGGKELGFNDNDIENALGMKLGEFLKRNPRDYRRAWAMLIDYANSEKAS